MDADHTPEGEHIAKMRLHQRSQLSDALAGEKNEFKERMKKMKESQITRFKKLDADGSGELSLEEVSNSFRRCSFFGRLCFVH